jgi:hypothetical protein
VLFVTETADATFASTLPANSFSGNTAGTGGNCYNAATITGSCS